jgi:hypothetical protein
MGPVSYLSRKAFDLAVFLLSVEYRGMMQLYHKSWIERLTKIQNRHKNRNSRIKLKSAMRLRFLTQTVLDWKGPKLTRTGVTIIWLAGVIVPYFPSTRTVKCFVHVARARGILLHSRTNPVVRVRGSFACFGITGVERRCPVDVRTVHKFVFLGRWEVVVACD